MLEAISLSNLLNMHTFGKVLSFKYVSNADLYLCLCCNFMFTFAEESAETRVLFYMNKAAFILTYK